MAARKRPNELDRKICFFRLDTGVDEAGAPIPFDPAPFLKRIVALPHYEVGGNYSPDDEGVFCCWVPQDTHPQKLMFGRLNQKYLPLYVCQGALSPLKLPNNGGFMYPVHAMFFYEAPHWYAACESNCQGPRITRLARYLSEKSGCPGLSFVPLIREDIFQQLQTYHNYRLLSVRCRPSYPTAMPKSAQVGRIEDLLDSSRELGQDPTIDLVWKAKPREREGIPFGLVQTVLGLLRHPDHQSGICDAKVKALNTETGLVDMIDLLNAQIATTVRVPRSSPRSAVPNSEAMYAAIEDAFERMRPKILGAVGFTLSNGTTNEQPGNSVA